MKVVQELFSNLQRRRKEKKEEKNFKESLSPKIAEFYFGYVAFVDKVKITKITNNDIQFKYKYLLPVGSTWEKPITQNLSELPDDIQKEIKQFLRIRKLKRLNKL